MNSHLFSMVIPHSAHVFTGMMMLARMDI
jgi:hypothetical protein